MLRDLPGDFGDIEDRRDSLRTYEAGWARTATEHTFQAQRMATWTFRP
jgi:hypothetical protein